MPQRAVALQKIDGFNREIGETVCQIRTLHQRLLLTYLVPCAGTALQGQGQYQLLEHARSALPIIPQHKQSLRRLEHTQRQQTEVLSQLNAQIAAKPDTAERLARALHHLDRTREQRSANQQAAAHAGRSDKVDGAFDAEHGRFILSERVDRLVNDGTWSRTIWCTEVSRNGEFH